MALEVELVTPEGQVFQGQAQMVITRSVEGELGILPGHFPLMAILEPAPLRLRLPDGEVVFAVGEGFCQVINDQVHITADFIEAAEDIDEARAREAHKRAQERLDETSIDEFRAQAAIKRAYVRLRAKELYLTRPGQGKMSKRRKG